jgi:hypothetical protein
MATGGGRDGMGRWPRHRRGVLSWGGAVSGMCPLPVQGTESTDRIGACPTAAVPLSARGAAALRRCGAAALFEHTGALSDVRRGAGFNYFIVQAVVSAGGGDVGGDGGGDLAPPGCRRSSNSGRRQVRRTAGNTRGIGGKPGLAAGPARIHDLKRNSPVEVRSCGPTSARQPATPAQQLPLDAQQLRLPLSHHCRYPVRERCATAGTGSCPRQTGWRARGCS